MSDKEIVTTGIRLPEKIEKVLIGGDLSSLTTEERVVFYNSLCQSLGLNPLTRPFEYITLSNKLTLYAKKDATEQLRKLYGVSVYDFRTETRGDVFVHTVFLQDASGRKDIASGAVKVGGLSGDNLANAIMKAETKAKRRGTLSICGLGMLDESDLETIRDVPDYTGSAQVINAQSDSVPEPPEMEGRIPQDLPMCPACNSNDSVMMSKWPKPGSTHYCKACKKQFEPEKTEPELQQADIF
jgi:hypothetical protein